MARTLQELLEPRAVREIVGRIAPICRGGFSQFWTAAVEAQAEELPEPDVVVEARKA